MITQPVPQINAVDERLMNILKQIRNPHNGIRIYLTNPSSPNASGFRLITYSENTQNIHRHKTEKCAVVNHLS